MDVVISLILGYFVGCLSPAKLVSRKRNVNLKETGTGNLGATNTALVLGKKAGYFVLIFDIFKSFFAYKAAKLLFPQLGIAGILAGIGVILGHAFPVFLHFQGGKGLASFGGLVLAHDPVQFAILLAVGISIAVIMDYGVYLAITAASIFPFFSYYRSGSLAVFLSTGIASVLVLLLHAGNFRRALRHEDPIHVRSGLRHILGKSRQ